MPLVLDQADRLPEAVAEGRPDYALEAEPLIKPSLDPYDPTMRLEL